MILPSSPKAERVSNRRSKGWRLREILAVVKLQRGRLCTGRKMCSLMLGDSRKNTSNISAACLQAFCGVLKEQAVEY